jgi:hypothetical protein
MAIAMKLRLKWLRLLIVIFFKRGTNKLIGKHMIKKAFWPFLSLLFLAPAICSAHQPRLADSNYIQVVNPEISQAFYGELKGGPTEYIID